ncbi:MAG: hypothetical protein HKUEN07_08640 [Rhodocyclaceae bacterium]|uniref:SnoaL-like domain-containing protein n=1 Tax=Candidatus Desulfobacillus denitrificans TaxID=2608985 RepID=A0A809QVD8_9PROT|nr:hypothetical protein [Rhodocyclaceae bacterium]MCL4724065.1 hypothetical protein [Rhodocyclaceae bacterium]BBO19413.1 conserved hypothetical protein [Candidatus Desulfobacillus denitrificans]GIK45407.1 MAG: hypothetical protein BroJett012_13100 [Betaproteobacteria bacterium]GJQ54295.1 MAG: hypothetical protein HKUEN07_08640 [Rhodocyclaceae bacterium]
MNAALPLLLLGLLLAAPAGAQPAVPAQSAQVAGFEDMKAARTALDELIRAYETGDVGLIQSRLDPGMIGYQRFIDGLRRDTTALKQIRLHLFEANVTAGPDVTMIEAAWEKRFFGVADFTPGLFRGRSTFLMHRAKEGWRLAAVSGDNPFSSEAGALATLSVMPAALPLGSLAPCPGAAVPLAIELVDPDLAGLNSVTIELASSQGDREGIVLTAVSPGRFRRPTTPVCQEFFAPIPGSGIVEVNAAAVPATLTFRYIDANPGANRPPATLMRAVVIR